MKEEATRSHEAAPGEAIADGAMRWSHHRDIHRAARGVLVAAEPSADDGAKLAKLACEAACACAVLEDIDGLVAELAELAAAGAAAIVRRRFELGTVTLHWPDGRTRVLPPGQIALPAPLWLAAVCAACIVRDAAARATLCRSDCMNLVAHAPNGAEPFWQPLCEAFAALMRQSPSAIDPAHAAHDALPARSNGASGTGLPGLPLARLIACLGSGRTANWAEEVSAALAASDGFDHRTFIAPGFFPLSVAALCAVAHDRGVWREYPSHYLPARLVGGELPVSAVSVEYTFPSVMGRSASEIRWWLDRAGAPRHARIDRWLESGNAVLARCDIAGWDAAPNVRLECLLDASGPPLLDPGELLLIAEWHAGQVHPDEANEGALRLHLAEALAALDEILGRLGSASAVAADALTSDRGRALYEHAPDRFERERLEAMRAEYARRLDTMRASRTEAEEQARAGIIAMHELIAAQLVPLLDALADPAEVDRVDALRPRADDYARAFAPAAAALARGAYERLWNDGPQIAAPSSASCAGLVHVAPAAMLARENELSRHFADGYRSIARLLHPQRVWVCWKYTRPGEPTTVAYDGLVWCDDRWTWFPQPYRALEPLIRQR